jgi:hypothetical protein
VAILERDLRASDHDREAAVAFLKAHYADGRMAEDELAWRTDAAYRAVAVRELAWLTSDLPAAPRPRRRAPVLPVVLLVAAIALWLVTVPPEATLVLLVLMLVAVLLLSPLWIPALLAFAAYRLIRARVVPR